MNCRHCRTPLKLELIDLGTSPPSNAYLKPEDLASPETYFPLRVLVCEECWLVQTEDFTRADELFDAEYAYFSSFSSSWLKHSEIYAKEMVKRFRLGAESRVVEVASNDGYLLQYFKARGVPCLGIEPTASTAEAARGKGIEVVEEFFGVALAEKLVGQGIQADLTAANNVLAHVPDINDFVAGFAGLLKRDGVATFEFPHLLNLLELNQFDTIYHEHFSYLSLTAVDRIFSANGLRVFDVDTLPTHGGSLRVFACREDSEKHERSLAVGRLLHKEDEAGLTDSRTYGELQKRAETIKHEVLEFLLKAKREGARVVGYGAAAKGNTLLNFAGVRADLIDYVVDRNPNKQGRYLPGSRIPIVGEERLREDRPDFVVILPWNLHQEVAAQLAYIHEWGGRFVTTIPRLAIG